MSSINTIEIQNFDHAVGLVASFDGNIKLNILDERDVVVHKLVQEIAKAYKNNDWRKNDWRKNKININ